MSRTELKRSRRLLPIVVAVGLSACAGAPGSTADRPAPEAAPAGAGAAAAALSPGSKHYFARRTPAGNAPGRFNYEFVRFAVDDARGVTGVQISQPYGTDGMAGSFRGVVDPRAGVVRAQLDYLAEGERYRESRDFALAPGGLDLGYQDPDGQPAIAPRQDAAAYRALRQAFRQQQLEGALNTTDRTRLLQVEPLREYLSQDQLQSVRFYERYVDLDHDGRTAEYLLYVVDPMLCGTGGCKLFVLGEDGRLLSETSVVKLPVYTTRSSIEEERGRRGQWRHLYVWSQGMRRLEAPGGRYPPNASTAPRVLERQLLDLPDHYRLLMDHLD